MLCFDLTFLPLVAGGGVAATKTVKPLRRDDRPRAHAGRRRKIPNLLCYEDLIDAPGRPLRLARVRREHRQLAVLHHRAPPATPRACSTATARRCCTPTASALPDALNCSARRRHPAGGADVPRQRLGPALRGLHDRRQAGASPAPALDGKSLYELFEGEQRHRLGRRADGLAGAARPTSTANGLKFSTMQPHRRSAARPARRR
ncbi:MAG: hypothetical protein MZW92_23225 [Comamonadaceae bacterium]|nr:hypothetical protein [Comamonadaceae bacterium]